MPQDTLASNQPEPWLRGTFKDIPSVPRAVLHALQLAEEDLERWCGPLSDNELCDRPHGLPCLAFQLRHIARSIDRLLTYADGQELRPEQVAALQSESTVPGKSHELFRELGAAFAQAREQVALSGAADLEASRAVGKKKLPTTLGGLLVHVADHTQRHVGQAVTTAKILLALREKK